MKQVLEFPYRPKTENDYRGMQPMVRHRVTKQERAKVRAHFDHGFTLPPGLVGPTDLNTFQVQFTRIANRELDDDNLRGTFKAFRDELALWLGLKSDTGPRFRASYAQERAPKGVYGVRVVLTDLSAGEDRKRVLAGFGEPLPVKGRRSAPVRSHLDRAQGRLPFLKVYAALPWKQNGQEHLTELPQLSGAETPPETLTLTQAGKTATLIRFRCATPVLGTHWLYKEGN